MHISQNKTEEKLFGRLKSRSLTKRQDLLYETLFKEISISCFDDIFHSNYDKVFLEIGFGSGDHIAELAINNRDYLYIGCEPFVNGVASLLVKISDYNIKNILIYKDDARKLIKESKDSFFDGVFLLFPDPWPKRKHQDRRFIQDNTINELYRILKDDGLLKVASDHNEYQKWMKKMILNERVEKLFKAEVFNSQNRPKEECWPKTKYEKKAKNEIIFMICSKISS